MHYNFKSLTFQAFLVCFLAFGSAALAQDGTIYPLEAPAEPRAILLGTGGVENQPAKERTKSGR